MRKKMEETRKVIKLSVGFVMKKRDEKEEQMMEGMEDKMREELETAKKGAEEQLKKVKEEMAKNHAEAMRILEERMKAQAVKLQKQLDEANTRLTALSAELAEKKSTSASLRTKENELVGALKKRQGEMEEIKKKYGQEKASADRL